MKRKDKRYLLHKSRLDPYDIDIYLFVGNQEEFNGWLQRKFNVHVDQGMDARALVADDKSIVVWMTDRGEYRASRISMLAHEAIHVSWYVHQMIGGLFSQEIQEPQCYMVQRMLQDWMGFLYDNTDAKGRYKIRRKK